MPIAQILAVVRHRCRIRTIQRKPPRVDRQRMYRRRRRSQRTGRLQVFQSRGSVRIFEARPPVCRFISPDGGGDRKERRNRTGGKTNVISSHHIPASFTRRNSTRKESRCSDGLHDPEGSCSYVDIHMEIFPGIRIVDSSGSQSRFRCIDDGLPPEPDVVRIRRQTFHHEIDRLAGSVRTGALGVRARAFRGAFVSA